jgi:cullin 3
MSWSFLCCRWTPSARFVPSSFPLLFPLSSFSARHINSANSSHLSFEELYRLSYKLVLHKHGELLYNGVCETISNHLNQERTTKVTSQPDELLLNSLRSVYERHIVNMRLIKDVLMYLDRSHASNNRKLPIFEQGIVIFRSVVAQHAEVRGRVQRLLLDSIRRHRNGEAMDVSLIRSVLAMLVELGISNTSVYVDEFETQMLQQTAAFYHEESREVLASNPVYEYCKYAERRLNEERQRALLVMHPSTVPKLMALLESKLVAEHAIALVEDSRGGVSSSGSSGGSGSGSAGVASSTSSGTTGFLWQCEQDRYEDLNRLFRLFASSKQMVVWRPPPELAPSEKDKEKEKSSPPVVVLKDVMKAQIMRKGLALVFDPERQKEPVELIQGLLDLRQKYALIVEKAFHNDRLYNTGLKEVSHLRIRWLLHSLFL